MLSPSQVEFIGIIVGLSLFALALAGISTYVRRAFIQNQLKQYIERMVKTAESSMKHVQEGLEATRRAELKTVVQRIRSHDNVDLADAVQVLGDNELAQLNHDIIQSQTELQEQLAKQRAEAAALVPFVAELLQGAVFFGISVAVAFLIAILTSPTPH